jgi:hypothetical protein
MAQADSVPSAVRVLITGAAPKPSTPVRTAHAEFLGAGYPPQPTPLHHAFDPKERPDHVAPSAYLVADTKQNVSGDLI